MKMLIVYVVTLVLFTGVDFVWLGIMGNAFYRPSLGDMAAPGFRAAPAVVFYLLFAFGVVVFVVRPALAVESLAAAAGYGALFGLVGYGVYDLTNQATLKTWPLALTLVDMAWGTLLTGLAASAAYAAGRWAQG
jgi:uncharacterized membrane protein